MTEGFICPVCRGREWEGTATMAFQREGKETLPEYERLRWEVLFDCWFDGADCVELRSVCCKHCGFMTYTPRPDESDIDVQYVYLDTHQTSVPTRPLSEQDAGTRRRIQRVFDFLAPRLPGRTLRFLDYGGSDGRLLLPFAEAGHSCDVVDYHPEPQPGIRRIGSTIADIPDGQRYDVILCCHVLEHMADPATMLRQLGSLLAEDGLLYVEVPDEIWRGIPITYDPVTHVNFFPPAGLELLCAAQCLHAVARRAGVERFGRWRVRITGLLLRKGDMRPSGGDSAASPERLAAVARAQSLQRLRPSLLRELDQLLRIRLPNRRASWGLR